MPEHARDWLYVCLDVVHQMFVSHVVQFTHVTQSVTQSELSHNLYAERETKQHTHSFLIYCNERERAILSNVRF